MIKFRFKYTELENVVDIVLQMSKDASVFLLEGDLGAGKTTLAQVLLRRLGVNGSVTSPTYTYINMYEVGHQTICHFDLYRIETAADFEATGFLDYITAPDTISVIEWPAVAKPFLVQAYIEIRLFYVDDQTRDVELKFCFPKVKE